MGPFSQYGVAHDHYMSQNHLRNRWRNMFLLTLGYPILRWGLSSGRDFIGRGSRARVRELGNHILTYIVLNLA